MRRLIAALCAAALGVAACGTDGSDAGSPTTTTLAASTGSTSTGSTSTGSTSTAPAPSTSTTTTTTAAPPGERFETEALNRTFVDASRRTPATAQTEEQPDRTIEVWIDRPVVDGPRPLVIFAHGITGHPTRHEMIRRHLAGEGFVVVAPAFPLTNRDVPGAALNVGDTAEQIGDASFLIDAIRSDPDLAPRVADGPVGMIGHSLGGLTTAGAALSLVTRDPRIGAAVVMSAGFGGDVSDEIPVMVLHGDSDGAVPYTTGVTAYEALRGPRMFVTLLGGDHNRGIGDDDSELGVATRGLAAAFFADALHVDEGQVAALESLPLDVVSVQAGGVDGEFDDWRDYFA